MHQNRSAFITSVFALTLVSVLSGAAEDPPAAKLEPVPFTDVHLEGGFWAPRQEINRTISIPHSIEMLKKAGNLTDLELAASHARSGYIGPVFIDSDLYKAVEAACYSLANHPDPGLEKQVDEIITRIAAAQEPDGYLNSWKQVNEPDKRWVNLRDQHELYCAGHLFEAAVAHYRATGKRTLLDVAVRYADYIDSVFGSAPGKRMGYPGHEEIELALFKLWKVTGEDRHYKLAQFFLESRGQQFFAKEHNTPLDKYEGKYWQDDVPLRDHKKIAGHAVRAAYLLSGATDYAIESHDQGIVDMLDTVWRNTTEANMYITGGIGSSAKNEGFTVDYDLPNASAYQETCASVAMIMWNHRLGLLTGEGKYADCAERALFNGFLSGVSLDGTKFFYVNPLASNGKHHRTEWYSCACCPPNVTRTLAQIGGYAYSTSPSTLWVNQYMQGQVKTKLDGEDLAFTVKTDYPWDGKIRLDFQTETSSSFTLRLRIPQWCKASQLSLNGDSHMTTRQDGGYLLLEGQRSPGDVVELTLDMPVQQVAANPEVKENTGKLALQRGPVVYCLEAVDQSVPVHDIALPYKSELIPELQPGLLGGIVTLKGKAQVAESQPEGVYDNLYAMVSSRETTVTAIPYFAWDNRSAGEMAVWLPSTPAVRSFGGLETIAAVSATFAAYNCSHTAANDGKVAGKSSDQPEPSSHWWPHKGTMEWLEYEWPKPQLVSSASVFWFDDTGRGECRVPENWHMEYLDSTTKNWLPVKALGPYETAMDRFCKTSFEPIHTTNLRLIVKMQDGYAAGVHEWQVNR